MPRVTFPKWLTTEASFVLRKCFSALRVSNAGCLTIGGMVGCRKPSIFLRRTWLGRLNIILFVFLRQWNDIIFADDLRQWNFILFLLLVETVGLKLIYIFESS